MLLDELGGTRAPVKVVDTEELDGVPTTLYRLVTNLASLLSASPRAGSQTAAYRGIGATLNGVLDRQGRPGGLTRLSRARPQAERQASRPSLTSPAMDSPSP